MYRFCNTVIMGSTNSNLNQRESGPSNMEDNLAFTDDNGFVGPRPIPTILTPRLDTNTIGRGRPLPPPCIRSTTTSGVGVPVHPYRFETLREELRTMTATAVETERRIAEADEGENCIIFGFVRASDMNNDCKRYFQGGCAQGSKCFFRHSEAALNSLLVCQDWANGFCSLWSACPFRHSTDDEILAQLVPDANRNRNPSSFTAFDNGWSMEVTLDGLLDRSDSLIASNAALLASNADALSEFQRFQHTNHRVWAFPSNESTIVNASQAPSSSSYSHLGHSDSSRQGEDNDNSNSRSRDHASGAGVTITFTNNNTYNAAAAGFTQARNQSGMANAANDSQSQNNRNRNVAVDLRSTIDCIYYFSSGGHCRRGDLCRYRHSAGALGATRVCREWIRFNCRGNCNLRHSKTGINTNQNARERETRSAIGSEINGTPSRDRSRGVNTIIINSRRAKDDCRDFLNNECAYGDHCHFRHSKYVKDNYKFGGIGVCSYWESKRSCLSCLMLHHFPPVKCQRDNAPSQDDKEKKTDSVKKLGFECKICYCDLEEIKEKGDRLVALNCGHLLCGQCCRSIYLSDVPICPYCRKKINLSLPLFV